MAVRSHRFIPRLVLLGYLLPGSMQGSLGRCDYAALTEADKEDRYKVYLIRSVREDDLVPLQAAFSRTGVQQDGSLSVNRDDAITLVRGGSSPTDSNWLILNRTVVNRRTGKIVGAIQIGRKHVHSLRQYQTIPEEKVAQILFVMDPGAGGGEVIQAGTPEIARAFEELGLSRLVTRAPVHAFSLQSALRQLGFRKLSSSFDRQTEYFELRRKDFQPACPLPAVRPWIKRVSDVSPPQEDPVLNNVDQRLVPLTVPWKQNPVTSSSQGPFTPMEAKEFDPSLILIPQAAHSEIENLLRAMDQAPNYADGIHLLRDYLTQVGLIQSYKQLRLLHASHVMPNKILRDGILSSQELMARGEAHSRWGQNMGDGVYTVGVEGWRGVNDWGSNQYEITIPNARIFMGNNVLAGAFVRIFDEYREKWNLPRWDDDTIRAAGSPQGVFSFNGILARLPHFYSDMGVIGASTRLEILIKTRRIPPSQIRVLPPLPPLR